MKTFGLVFYLSAFVCLLSASKCEKETVEANLPETAKTWLQTNYPGYEIEEAEQETLCTGQVVYEVEIETAEDKELEIAFDNKGNYLFTESELPSAALPEAIQKAVASRYKGFAIREADKLTLASGAVQYEVEIKKGGKVSSTLYDAQAALICASPNNTAL